MTTARKNLLLLLLAALLFDRLFWEQTIGIDLALFAVAILALVLAERGLKGLSAGARAAGLGTLAGTVMLVVHGSIIATVAVLGGLFVFAGLAHERDLRTATSGLVQWASALLFSPARVIGTAAGAIGERHVPRRGRRWAGVVLLPLLVATLYFFLYRGANSRFETMTAGFLDSLSDWIGSFLSEIFTAHALFFGAGLLVCASLLLRANTSALVVYERSLRDDMERRRRARAPWQAAPAMNALDRERRMGVVLLVLVNALLLMVNLIDIQWMWFGFDMPEGFSLKEFVHEGTWLLIVSILLSMGILLHLFRGNLNFHRNNRVLRTLALIWLAQNFILGISVFLRNYHYIAFHGLAYKRIGVVVFLALMLVGLVTLAIKVRTKRTLFHLLRVNGWAAFAMLVGLSTVDWDSTIVKYNLHHWNSGEIDVDNYLAMSDKVLPLLLDGREEVYAQMAHHAQNTVRWVQHLDPVAFEQELDLKRRTFLHRFADQDWQSWTWADQRTYAALAERGLAE